MKVAPKIVALFLFFTTGLFAQLNFDPNNYKPLGSVGEIPDDFLKSMSEKWSEDIVKHSKENNGKIPSMRENKFYLNSNYVLNEMLLGGKIVFNDPLSKYIQKVVEKTFENNPDVIKDLRFYVLKTNTTNAFSTDQGMIFITTGLLAELENEAQLSFALTHEVVHYLRKHNIKGYIDEEELFSKSEYKNTSYDDKIRIATSRSREHEMEADSLGFGYFQKSNYTLDEAEKAMDALLLSQFPFEEYSFQLDFLNNTYLNFPKDRFKLTYDPLEIKEDDSDDSKSTHPNMQKRKVILHRMSKSIPADGKKTFLVSEEEFNTCKNIARFEAVRIDLVNRNYVDVIYNASLFSKKFPNSIYLEKSIGKALYAISKYKKAGLYTSELQDTSRKIQGNLQVWNNFFNDITTPEAQALSMGYLYSLYKKYPDDAFVLKLFRDVLSDFLEYSEYKLQDFKKAILMSKNKAFFQAISKIKESGPVDSLATNSTSNITINKYEELRKAQRDTSKRVENVDPMKGRISTKIQSDETPFYLSAFGEYVNDTTLANEFVVAYKTAKEKKNKPANSNLRALRSIEDLEEQRMEKEKQNVVSDTLHISRIVVANPYYYKIKQDVGLEMIQSEKKQREFVSSHTLCANAAGLDVEIIDTHDYTAKDIDKYNDMALLNEWFSERLSHGEMEIIPLLSAETPALTKKYKSKFISTTGVLSFKGKRENRATIIYYSVLMYPVLPLGLIYAMTPTYKTYYYILVFDAETGAPVYYNGRLFKSGSHRSYINSIMYDTFSDLKK